MRSASGVQPGNESRPSAHESLVHVLGDDGIGLEGRARADDHLNTRLWLRLLACSTQIEGEIRELLRVRFGLSLSRFDYLAQLYRWPDGLQMRTLTRYLMVSGGNVTSLTTSLIDDGLVQRTRDLDDRRSYWVRLTAKGRRKFVIMARSHEEWLDTLFRDIPTDVKDVLYTRLGLLRARLPRDVVQKFHTGSDDQQ